MIEIRLIFTSSFFFCTFRALRPTIYTACEQKCVSLVFISDVCAVLVQNSLQIICLGLRLMKTLLCMFRVVSDLTAVK